MDRKNAVQMEMRDGDEGRTGLGCGNRKLPIELRNVGPQEMVGFLDGANVAYSQLLRQSSLPSPEVRFTTAARLRRIGRDGFNA